MRFVWFIRLLTLLTATAYAVVCLPAPWVSWLRDRIEHVSAFYTTLVSEPTLADAGLYLTAILAVAVAFVVIPRWFWGPWALSGCLLAMGICLFVRHLERNYPGSDMGLVHRAMSYAEDVCFALPPLILSALVQYSFVRERLHSSPPDNHATNV